MQNPLGWEVGTEREVGRDYWLQFGVFFPANKFLFWFGFGGCFFRLFVLFFFFWSEAFLEGIFG